MIQMFTKKRKGFTLIELIVVVAILGILAAIAVPRLTGSRNSANRSAVEANLRTVDSAVAIAEADGNLPATPTIANLVTGGYLARAVTINTVETKYELVKTSSGSWVCEVTLVANPYGTTLSAGNYTYDTLQSTASVNAGWK